MADTEAVVTRWPNAVDARREALDQAIRVHSHKEICLYNTADRIVEDAKVFEAYLKGDES